MWESSPGLGGRENASDGGLGKHSGRKAPCHPALSLRGLDSGISADLRAMIQNGSINATLGKVILPLKSPLKIQSFSSFVIFIKKTYCRVLALFYALW